jgi:hypothetical protein
MPPIIAWQFLLRAQPRHATMAASYWSADLSAEVTAIATAVLALFAIVTAYYARKAFLKQSEEVTDQAREIKGHTLAVEREQADLIDLTPGASSRQVPGLDPAADGDAWMANVANGSRRPIRNVTGKIEAAPGTPLKQAVLAGIWSDLPPSALAFSSTPTRSLINPPERPDIPLIRSGHTGALIFPIGFSLSEDARMTIRFTDDAGLHWQIDHDLHLEKLDNRADW